MFSDGRGKLKEITARRFEREAMFVLAARRVWSEGCDAAAASKLGCLRIPLARRTVGFRWYPPFDVPTIELRIFEFVAQLDAFADEYAAFVAVLELAADPGEAIPAPD